MRFTSILVLLGEFWRRFSHQDQIYFGLFSFKINQILLFASDSFFLIQQPSFYLSKTISVVLLIFVNLFLKIIVPSFRVIVQNLRF